MLRKARARMLSPTISISERVNQLDLKAALLYTWMIAHADDQGRLKAKPRMLKALIVPLREDISVSDVERSLYQMQAYGLITIYYPGDAEIRVSSTNLDVDVVQLTAWWEHQALRDPKPSKFDPPERWTDHVATQSRDAAGKFQR